MQGKNIFIYPTFFLLFYPYINIHKFLISKIQEISNYRNTFGNMEDLLQQKKKTSLNPRTLTKSEYNNNRPKQQRSPNKITEPKFITREDYLDKQTPKRVLTSREKPLTTYYTKRDTISIPMPIPPPAPMPILLEKRHLKPSYVRTLVPELEAGKLSISINVSLTHKCI